MKTDLGAHKYNFKLADVEKPDPEIDKSWSKEAIKRQKAMRNGKMRIFSYDEVMNKYLTGKRR